ncbi:MAG: hypothetical protein AB7O24_19195 [Kofleriaceae bacterium]
MLLAVLVLALPLVAAPTAGCGAPQRESDTLSESIRTFNDGIRWQRFANAATRIPLAQRSQFVDEMDQRAEDLRITDYEIVRVDTRGPREAKVHVKVSWYLDSEGTLRETHAMQTWERQGKVWLMVDELRVRGAQMPGLADPVSLDEQPAANAHL